MASVWIILCWNNISLLSLCLFVTQEHRRYLHVCQPRYLSVPPSLISFLARPRLSLSLSFSLFFIPISVAPARCRYLSFSLFPFLCSVLVPLSSLLYPPCSSSFHQLAPARLLLHKHWTQSTIIVMCCRVISGLADRSPSPSLPPSTPSPSPLRSLFLMLLFSVFLLARLRFSPRSIRPLLEIRFPSSFQYLYFNTILIIFIFNTI